MKRSGFKRKEFARVVAETIEVHLEISRDLQPGGRLHSLATPQRGRMALIDRGAIAETAAPPLVKAKRSPRYRRWVAGLACMHCLKPGPSQAAHADQGKGKGLKACDATLFPLCADSPLRRGCHSIFGDTGQLGKDKRRQLEDAYGKRTRRRARAANVYPKGWRED